MATDGVVVFVVAQMYIAVRTFGNLTALLALYNR
jgi:hypothetical protein